VQTFYDLSADLLLLLLLLPECFMANGQPVKWLIDNAMMMPPQYV
jgi:hypothetical protein